MGINAARASPELRARIAHYWKVHDQMWVGLKRVAKRLEEVNGSLSIEWSHKCAYHRLKKTRALVSAMNMKYFPVNACAFGLRSIQKKTRNMLICKALGFLD